LGIFPCEETSKNTAQNLFALAPLRDVIRHLRYCEQIFTIKLLAWSRTLRFLLQFADRIDVCSERL